MKKRKKVAVYIDGENISARKLDKINAIFEREGQLISASVYRRKNDKFTKRWHNISRRRKSINEISLHGTPQRDKIDKRIVRDINRDISFVHSCALRSAIGSDSCSIVFNDTIS